MAEHADLTRTEKNKLIKTICVKYSYCRDCPLYHGCKAAGCDADLTYAWGVKHGIFPSVASDQTAKADGGKPIYSHVPPAILDSIERVRAYGNAKYHDPENWRQVDAQRYWEAFLRHTRAAWNDYRAKDPESGLKHIEHCACNLAFILQFIAEGDADGKAD